MTQNLTQMSQKDSKNEKIFNQIFLKFFVINNSRIVTFTTVLHQEVI